MARTEATARTAARRRQHLGGRRKPRRRQDPRRHRRRRQLREQPRPGPLLLRERQGRRLRPGPDARQPRRLPHPRHRVRGRLRHRQEQGRQGPVRGDLHQAEQHLRLPAGPAHRRHGRARHDPRRPGQVPQPDHREGARPHGRRRRHPQGARGRRHGLATCRSAARRRPSGTSSRRSRPASASSTPSRCSSAASRTGSAASPRKACRSSATTSRARSARRSRHRVLTRLFMDRGVRLDRTYQLNFGGNTDFLNMLERERLESKKISKTNAVTSMLDYEIDADDIHVGPSRPRAVAARPQVVLHPDGGHDLRRRAAQRRAQARGLGQPQQRRRHHRRHPLPEAGPRPRPDGHARRAVELLHEEPAAARSTTTSRSTGSRRSSAARTTRRSSAPRAPGQARPLQRKASAAARQGQGRPPPRGDRRASADSRRRTGAAAAPVRAASWSGRPSLGLPRPARGSLAASLPAAADRAPCIGPGCAGVVPRSGRRSAAGQPRTSARPGAAARRPARPPAGPARLRDVRALPRRADAPAALPADEAVAPASSQLDARPRSQRSVRARPPRRAHRRRRPHRQQRADRPAHRAARAADLRAGRRSAFPELFEQLNASARRWGIEIIPWRNLREIFGVLRERRDARPARRLGLPSDGIPVRLFGAWTTLPAGPGDAGRQDQARDRAASPSGAGPTAGSTSRYDDPIDGRLERPGRAPAGDPGDRRRARGR